MRLIALALCLMTGLKLQAQSDAIAQYFDKYMHDDRFTVVFISPKMFDMVSKMDLQAPEPEAQAVLEIIKDLKGLRILTTQQTPRKFFEEAKAVLPPKGYEVLMTVRDNNSGDNVEFLVKESGDRIQELLLLVGNPNEFVMLSFVGDIDLKKIGELSKVLNVEGAEHLKKLENQ